MINYKSWMIHMHIYIYISSASYTSHTSYASYASYTSYTSGASFLCIVWMCKYTYTSRKDDWLVGRLIDGYKQIDTQTNGWYRHVLCIYVYNIERERERRNKKMISRWLFLAFKILGVLFELNCLVQCCQTLKKKNYIYIDKKTK